MINGRLMIQRTQLFYGYESDSHTGFNVLIYTTKEKNPKREKIRISDNQGNNRSSFNTKRMPAFTLLPTQ